MKLPFVFYSKNSIDSMNERLTELIRNKSFFYSAYYGWVDKTEFYLKKRALPNTGHVVKIWGKISQLETKNKIQLTVRPGWDFYLVGLIILAVINANVINGHSMDLRDIMRAFGYNLLGVACCALVMWVSVNIALEPIRDIVSNKVD